MKKVLTISIVALLFGLSACHDDDDNTANASELTKTEAKAKINSFNTTVTKDLQDLSSSKGLEALTSLTNLASSDDPFGGRAATDKKKLKAFMRSKGQTFQRIINKKAGTAGRTKDDAFNFAANTGIYEWDPVNEEFVRTGNANIIKIKFPSENSSTNNAEFRLNQYVEKEMFDEEWEEYTYVPTTIDADVSVDGVDVASFNLSATWDNTGFPSSGNINATVIPFSASVSFDVTSPTKNTLTASLTRDNKILFATSLTVLYSSADKADFNMETIDGYVQLVDLKVDGTIDVKSIDENDGENIDFNQFVDLTVSAEGKKVGKIVFVTETHDDFDEDVAYIQYTDGSKEKLEDVLQPVLDELDNIENDIDGENG